MICNVRCRNSALIKRWTVAPLGKIVYVCDDVLSDPANSKIHVVGAFNAIRPIEGIYPYRH